MKRDVLIVGGGMAGLSCATFLNRCGQSFQLLEASGRFGGRVGSDRVEGYVLDRGFQVFLDAYPTARELLDYKMLHLKAFQSGALIHHKGRFGVFADPLRHPSQLLDTLTGPLPMRDLFRLGLLNPRLKKTNLDQALAVEDQSTLAFLERQGYSERAIEIFWRPFLGGIFLEAELSTSARMFQMVFSLFARGRATLPETGMQAIPDQLASRLPASSLKLDCRVVETGPRHVRLASGEVLEGAHVVDARDPWSVQGVAQAARGTRCFYFAAEPPPWSRPWLVLCPEAKKIQTLSFLNQLHPERSPAGQALLSVSTLSLDATEDEIREDLLRLFGRRVLSWPLLRSYALPHALPGQNAGHLNPASRTGKNEAGVFCCGDHLETASIEGAMRSGKRIAEQISALSGHADMRAPGV